METKQALQLAAYRQEDDLRHLRAARGARPAGGRARRSDRHLHGARRRAGSLLVSAGLRLLAGDELVRTSAASG